jgi:hypothetical protein
MPFNPGLPSVAVQQNGATVYYQLGSYYDTNFSPLPSVLGVYDANNNLLGFAGNATPYVPASRAVVASQYPHARKALANVRSGTSNMKVAMIGDSTMLGRAASTTNSYSGARPYNQPAQLAKYLTAAGVTANNNSIFGSGTVFTNLANITAYDSRFTGSGSGLSTTGAYCMGANVFQQNAASTLTFTPTSSLTNYVVYYIDQSGVFTIDIGGSGTVTVTGGGTGSMLSATISAAASTSPLNINWSSGTAYPFGMLGWNSAVPEVSVVTMGWAGGGVQNWSNTNPSNPASHNALASLTLFAPDLTIIRAGINDWITATNTNIGNFITQLTAVVTTAQASGDVLLEISPYGSTTSATPATQAQMNAIVAAIYQVADANQCSVNNNVTRWGSATAMNALGYYDTDVLHYTKIGYADLAKSTFDYIMSM